MNLKPVMNGIKNRSGELVLVGAGALLGLYYSFSRGNNLNTIEYFGNPLIPSAPVMGASYYFSRDAERTLRTGGTLYMSILIGETIGEVVKRYTM